MKNPTHQVRGFFWVIIDYKTGGIIDILTFFWPTDPKGPCDTKNTTGSKSLRR